MLTDILNWLFLNYEKKGIEFCILRNYESLPYENVGNDIDLIIDQKAISINEELLKEMMNKFDLTCIRCVKRYAVHQYFFISNKIKLEKIIQFDFQFHGEWNGSIYLNNEEILNNKIKYRNFYIPHPTHEALITLFASLLWGGFVKIRYIEKIRNLINKDQEKFIKCLKDSFYSIDNELINILLTVDVEKCELNVRKLRQILTDTDKRKCGIIKNFVKKVKYYYYELKICKNYPGIMIAILGPDGVGKSTFINGINEILPYYFKEEFIIYRHLRPRMLKEPGNLFGKSKVDLNDQSSARDNVKNPNGIIISIFRLSYYLIDYIIGYYKIYLNPLRKMGVVVMDRYYYDFFVDPGRCRMKLPSFIVKCGNLFIKKPHMTIYLYAPTKVIRERKQELTFQEIERQNIEYRNLSEKYDFITLNANQPIDNILLEFEDNLVNILKKRSGFRY